MQAKLQAYRRNQVQEYVVWQVHDQRLDWFRLREGEYISLETDNSGIVRSEVFPGLWLAVGALLEGNMTQVLAVLQHGIESLAHATFISLDAFKRHLLTAKTHVGSRSLGKCKCEQA